MGRPLTSEEFSQALADVRVSALRLELQPVYLVDHEADSVRRFLAHEPYDPAGAPGMAQWLAQIRTLTAAGARFRRVRVHDDPPTDYQRWLRWVGRWNTEAGERIRYLTRDHATAVGLLPAAGDADWWLIDDRELIVMRFDPTGRRTSTELVDDADQLDKARDLWALAFANSQPDQYPTAQAA